MRGDASDLPVRVKRKGKWQFSLLTLLLFAAAASCLASAYAVHRNDTQRNRLCWQCFQIGLAVHVFHAIKGRIPTQDEGLDVLTDRNPYLAESQLAPGDLVDPWGSKVGYDVVDLEKENGFTLRSFGPNGIDDGGRKDDIFLEDIYNVTSISRHRLQLVGFLCVASYIFAAIGIALEHGRRKAATKRAGSSEDCEVSK